ncbi:hypothetical protein B0H13DRAFT_2352797 [Mycena leptocephala]|nr:hypothetical protein B0H13DRAFT_2352797 [Mycena leptocephala]
MHSPTTDSDVLSSREMPLTAEELCVPIDRPSDEVLALIFKPPLASSLPFMSRGVDNHPHSGTPVPTHPYLERSKPLRFRLSVNTEHQSRPPDTARIVEMLLPHLHRCSTLALCISDDDMRIWNKILRRQQKLHTLRILNVTIHSYAPDELWGPPESLFHFTALCTGIRSLRLSMGPTLHLHEKLNALQLTALDVRCTWDGVFLRHVCHHSHVLDTLVLRDYSACVFDGAAHACLPSLMSLVLEFRDGALAEGLINLALFLDLPNLGRLTVKGSGTPGVGHPLRHWQGLRPFPSLLTLRLENTVFQRPLDAAILGTLSANITHLQLRNMHRGPLNDAEILAGYANLAVIEIARGTQVRLPDMLCNMKIQKKIIKAIQREL